MTVAVLETGSRVDVTKLADGMIVRLAGELTEQALPELRELLLAPLPADCRDVVIDAGEVELVHDSVLAALIAARVWAEEQDRRFLLSRSSAALDAELEALDVADELPRLAALQAGAADATVLPLRAANS